MKLGKFLVGLGVGTVIGLLIAPKKGSEMRTDLKNKMDEMISKLKDIDKDDVKEEVEFRIAKIKDELADLDKEKAIKSAKKKGEELKEKTEELICLAKEKGTPILEKAANEVKEKTILVIKDVLNKLENNN